MVEENNESIKDMMRKIYERQEELAHQKEIKKFKMPFSGRLNKAKIKKNWITAILINENRTLDFVKLPIEDGTISIDGVPRIATADYILSYKGKPVVIFPSWSLKPFSPEENYTNTVKDQMTITGRKLLIAKMKHDVIVPKKGNFGMIGWIVLGAIVLGGAYYLIKGGKFF